MKHFRFSDFIRSNIAYKMGIDNKITDARYIANIYTLVDNVLDPLREIINVPIYINSGYRCGRLNRAVGGSNNSQHMRGLAADISFGKNEHLCEWIYSILKSEEHSMYQHIDQCILYKDKRFIHVSISELGDIPRRMFFIR